MSSTWWPLDKGDNNKRTPVGMDKKWPWLLDRAGHLIEGQFTNNVYLQYYFRTLITGHLIGCLHVIIWGSTTMLRLCKQNFVFCFSEFAHLAINSCSGDQNCASHTNKDCWKHNFDEDSDLHMSAHFWSTQVTISSWLTKTSPCQ